MLPPNWGQAEPGPRGFDLQADGLAVRERYRELGDSPQLDAIMRIALEGGADTVYIDRPYTDFDYRSDHAHYYVRSFRPPPETTERLIFADNKRVTGACVVRPLAQCVGRTMLPPHPEVAPYVTCTAEMPVNAFGHQWTVNGYPFTSQDGEYGVCAHAAIWSIARYHHLRFHSARVTTSAIIDSAGVRERPDKTALSDGMYGFDIVRAFRGIGLPARVYDVARIGEGAGDGPPETLDSTICRYLNSGIPVAVMTDNHMMVAVGYGERDDGGIFYIVSDDNECPYKRVEAITDDSRDAWRGLVIPQPGRIHVSGEAAQARAEECFEDRLRADTGPGHLLEDLLAGKLHPRAYAATSTSYLSALAGRGAPEALRDHHVYAPKSNWLWITEFQDTERPAGEQVVGEIAIDATSAQRDPQPLFGNADGYAYLWPANSREPNVAFPAPQGARYASALPDRRESPAPEVPQFAPYGGTSIS